MLATSGRRVLTALATSTLAVVTLIAVPATQAMAATPETFSVRNLTQYPMITTQVQVATDRAGGQEQGWSHTFGDRFPYPGQIIQPGQVMYFDLAVNYNGPSGTITPSSATIDYTIGDRGPAIHVSAYQNGKVAPFEQTSFACTSADPSWTCSHDAHGADVYDTIKHDTVVRASDATLQAQLMNALCQPGNPNVHCEFTGKPTLTDVTLPYRPVGDKQYNYADNESEHSWKQKWESGTTMKVGASYSPVDIDVENVIKVEVKVSYDHEWGTAHAASVKNSIDIEPGEVGWIEAEISAQQITGDLRVGVGNDYWTLTNVTFTAPKPPAATDIGFAWSPQGQHRKMNPTELAAAPPTS